MKYGEKEAALFGRHFVINIALPENFSSGLATVNRDPRQLKKKPDAYFGLVEETGPQCVWVKPGDRVLVRRWEYQQMNVDDERLVASENDLLTLDGGVPAPRMITVRLIRKKIETSLVIPDTARSERGFVFRGEVLAYSPYGMRELKDVIEVGKIIIFQKSDSEQWATNDGRAVIKVCDYFEILAIAEKCQRCDDVCLIHASQKETQLTVI